MAGLYALLLNNCSSSGSLYISKSSIMKKPSAKKIKWVLITAFVVWGLSLTLRYDAYADSCAMITLAMLIYANE